MSNLKGIRIYKSNEDLSTSSQRSLARYPNIIGWAGYDYSLTNEISNDVFSSCQVIISKEEDDKKKEEKKIKKIKNIFFWAGCGIFLIFTIYSILCLFPFMEDYNIFKLMNLEGNAANIIGIVIGPIYTIITNKYLIKS